MPGEYLYRIDADDPIILEVVAQWEMEEQIAEQEEKDAEQAEKLAKQEEE
jgi:hypothetical protein